MVLQHWGCFCEEQLSVKGSKKRHATEQSTSVSNACCAWHAYPKSTAGQGLPWQTAMLQTRSLDAFLDILAVVTLWFWSAGAGQGHAAVGSADLLTVPYARHQLGQEC